MASMAQTLRKILVLSLFVVVQIMSATVWAGNNNVSIHFEQIDSEQLQVTYTVDRPVDNFTFHSTPDKSRADFWSAKSDEFELIYTDGHDLIRRIDGEAFETVVFAVDIVDISLPNYYRPFSPFFDSADGLVIHTGQYFVCRGSCINTSINWQIEVSATNKNIVHYQGTSVSAASWKDSHDGRSFYLGPKSPVESKNLVAVIDSGLPAKLKMMLDVNLPGLIELLGNKFETLETKPLVFATYNIGDPERSGFQGGVLNKTVFMHWWGSNLAERINENDELWFIAHEIAHFYQSRESKVDVDEVAWIHEGFAELMAADLLAQSNEELKSYVQRRFKVAKSECASGLKITPIGHATELKQFNLHYKCGLLLHRFIARSANENLTVFDLWNRYRDAINQGMQPSKETYFNVVKKIMRKEDFLVLQKIVGTNLASDEITRQFLDNSIF